MRHALGLRGRSGRSSPAPLGADRCERRTGRQGYRNGTRARRFSAPTGALALTLQRATVETVTGRKEWTSTFVPSYQRRLEDLPGLVVRDLDEQTACRVSGSLSRTFTKAMVLTPLLLRLEKHRRHRTSEPEMPVADPELRPLGSPRLRSRKIAAQISVDSR